MSARFLQVSAFTNDGKHKALGAALLVALAVNPNVQDVAALHDDPGHDAPAEAPPIRRQCWSGNSVGHIYAKEKTPEPAYAPPCLLLVNPSLVLDSDALQKVFDAVGGGLSDPELQEVIDTNFPRGNFIEHLSLHVKAFWADKPFTSARPHRGRSWLMRKLKGAPTESVEDINSETLDTGTIIALRHIMNGQKWLGAHFRTIAQIMHTSLWFDLHVRGIRRDGTLMRTPGTSVENPACSNLSVAEIEELLKMSSHFKRVAGQVISKAEALEADLDLKSREELSKYLKSLDLKGFDELVPSLRVKKRLHSIQWMLAFGSPIFFAKHRDEFAEVMDLLTQYSGPVEELSAELLKNLGFLGRAMREYLAQPGDLIPLKEHCKQLAAHRHWVTFDEPL